MGTKKALDKKILRQIFLGRMTERNILVSLILNIVLSYILLSVCRIIFVLMNSGMYAQAFDNNSLWEMFKGSMLFDTAAVCYLNVLYVVLLAFPLHYREGKTMQSITKWSFVIPNAIGVISNLCDCVYVPFTGRRTTFSVFSEFGNEDNMGTVIGTAVLDHWWLLLIGAAIIWAICRLYTPAKKQYRRKATYYAWHIPLLAVAAFLLVTGMRGGIGKAVRPITLSNANAYVSSPAEAPIILNTPFSIIRTIGKKAFTEKNYYSEEELAGIFNPVQQFALNGERNRKNIVVIIVESFGKEYIGAYNPRPEGSLTPFLDSLIEKSRSYRHSYGNGMKSIDGMPSILSSIPMFVEPFITTEASLNHVSGIAGLLGEEGYNTAFFHGAPNGSMGFQAFAKATGFERYYGLDEYCESPLHKGMDDYDGTWAIWDEPFLQYYAECMNGMEEPFFTSVFTASSHDPFRIPEEYSGKFRKGNHPFVECVQYTDNALRLFFEYAEKQNWYRNTLFVITADHTNCRQGEKYTTSAGMFEVPVIFFMPEQNGPFTPGIDEETIAQQIDIMPTILEYTGYSKPFVAFGKSLLTAEPEESYAVNFTNEVFQYYKGEYVLLFDGEKSLSLYNIRKDPLMKENIMGTEDVVKDGMERELKAIIQQYMTRMLHDRLTTGNGVEEAQ